MITLLRKLLSREKTKLVGTLNWSINWTDAGFSESGAWLMYEDSFGNRYFKLTNKATFTSKKEHPGFSDLKAWSEGGVWPLGANAVK